MSTSPKVELICARLNPFAFITDTTMRFYLLLAMVIVISPLMLFGVYTSFIQVDETVEQCLIEGLPAVRPSDLFGMINTGFFNTLVALLFDRGLLCLKPIVQESMTWVALGMAALLGLAFVIYRLERRWFMLFQRPVQQVGPELIEVTDCIAALTVHAGITERPAVWWAPLNHRINAWTLGRPGYHHLLLTSGLVMLYFRDNSAFRAIVLHELSHIRYADTRRIFFAQALWWAFVAVVVLPYVGTMVWTEPWDGALLERLCRALFFTVLVYFTQQAIFRAREYYADAQAVLWDGGQTGPMLSGLKHLQSAHDGSAQTTPPNNERAAPTKGRLIARATSLARIWQSYHPDWKQRERTLDEPTSLLGVSIINAFVVGLITAIALVNLTGVASIVTYIALGSPDHYTDFVQRFSRLIVSDFIILPLFAASLIASTFLVGTIGLNIWRTVFAEQISRHRRLRPILLGAATAGGFALGDAIGGFGLLYYRIDIDIDGKTLVYAPAIIDGLGYLGWIYSGWFIVLVIGFNLLFCWLEATARAWTAPALAARPLRQLYLAGLLLGAGVLSLWLGLVFMVPIVLRAVLIVPSLMPAVVHSVLQLLPMLQDEIVRGIRSLAGDMLQAMVRMLALNANTLWIMLLLLIVPLSAWFWRRRVAFSETAAWAFSDPPDQAGAIQATARVSLRPDLALLAGIGAGIVFSVLIPVIDGIQAPAYVSQYLYGQQLPAYLRFLGIVQCMALAQALVALAITLSVREVAVVHGLFASFTTGTVIAGGMWVFFTGQGGQYSWFAVFHQLTLVINSGLLLALPLCLVGVILRQTWRVGWRNAATQAET